MICFYLNQTILHTNMFLLIEKGNGKKKPATTGLLLVIDY